MAKSTYSRSSGSFGDILITRSGKVQRKSAQDVKGTLTIVVPAFLVEAVFFAEQAAAPLLVVESPVPAVACDTTTQLPKPAPEMNCYESCQSE